MDKILIALQEYTKDFYSNVKFEESNVVGSPLGSWLLLASIANSLNLTNNPELKTRIENCLHLSTEDAADAVEVIMNKFPALNYVAKAWTNSDLSSLPAVQEWVEANILIPHEGAIPSQDEVDEWASTNTNNLIKEFPSRMSDDTMLVIANIVYSKLAWKTKFVPVPTPESMSGWGVNKTMNATATHDMSFFKNPSGEIFAVYNVRATGEHKESVKLVTCLSKTLEPVALLEVLNHLDDMETIRPSDESLLNFSGEMYKVKEVRKGESPLEIEVNVPAWEAGTTHELFKNESLGYQDLLEAFNQNASGNFAAEVKQVAVARFDKDGFEAAALTSMLMSRCAAMPSFMEQTVYELNFTKPFVYVSYTDTLPVFSGYIQTAKESE